MIELVAFALFVVVIIGTAYIAYRVAEPSDKGFPASRDKR